MALEAVVQAAGDPEVVVAAVDLVAAVEVAAAAEGRSSRSFLTFLSFLKKITASAMS